GEEWRKGWHPEIIPPLQKQQSVLIIGGGPTGLEAARAMAQRGAEVALAEATQEWGGRVTQECRLPGLAAWGRVRDWRLGQLRQASNAQLYLDSRLSAEDVLSFGIPHIAIATGARWR
ncbi:FAD-dependent oxidoreductase, partial [Tritonibacter sp. SIMBA_163]